MKFLLYCFLRKLNITGQLEMSANKPRILYTYIKKALICSLKGVWHSMASTLPIHAYVVSIETIYTMNSFSTLNNSCILLQSSISTKGEGCSVWEMQLICWNILPPYPIITSTHHSVIQV